jgi:hypothetical protein
MLWQIGMCSVGDTTLSCIRHPNHTWGWRNATVSWVLYAVEKGAVVARSRKNCVSYVLGSWVGLVVLGIDFDPGGPDRGDWDWLGDGVLSRLFAGMAGIPVLLHRDCQLAHGGKLSSIAVWINKRC